MLAVRLRTPPSVLHRHSEWEGNRNRSEFLTRFRTVEIGKVSPLKWKPWRGRGICCQFRANRAREVKVGVAQLPSVVDEAGIAGAADVLFEETMVAERTKTLEGKVTVRLDCRLEEGVMKGRIVMGCDLDGKWVLHWGVTYFDEFGSEWDQPPVEMRPPGSVPVKDYAVETPLKKSSSASKGQILHEVHIDLNCSSSIAAIHFVLKEEETGAWFHHRGMDFRIPLFDNQIEDSIAIGGAEGFSIIADAFSRISRCHTESEGPHHNPLENGSVLKDTNKENRLIEGYYKEYSILREERVLNSITVSVMKSEDMDITHLLFDTDIPGEVIVHWGVCRDNSKVWHIPNTLHPPKSRVFREKALRTLLQKKTNGVGSWGLFPLDKDVSGVPFVIKLNEYTWLDNMGNDFYIPLISESSLLSQTSRGQTEKELEETVPEDAERTWEDDSALNSDEIIYEIRNLVTDISFEKSMTMKSKEAQENIREEIEKLAAEAYSIFRSSSPVFVKDPVSTEPTIHISSGTGSGYEILCQGFNWESNKSGGWYSDLCPKASELSKLGFTTVWLPPPTESVSPEGYMPKDLYNLNSRYGSVEELKNLVHRFHDVGIKVLGDVVLNHRCAHYQNKYGIWNIFGGRLNWDDRAIVADDPHFQGRGNKSSGDNFHAAPNIDHCQDFVRRDLKEWLCWLRKEIGYDGWRLDFVRGFWGGYVKDYLEASGPYFAVGEYWDSLSYTYGQMDHNQDAHRQRIIDWINATNGTAAAFDVTTKGILHASLEKYEYWRLSDEKGKPPGVVGWWPSRAVTFIENHDTGSTQGHWRFPAGKEMQGYAYILTHPGTPTVFYDHIFSHYYHEISTLMSLRHRTKIHCRSTVEITKAERDVYAAEIDEKVAMKIGPGYYEPSGHRRWIVAVEGRDFKVWEAA